VSPIKVLGSANKSLARSTSRCRKTASIVSLERGVCSGAELHVFSCYRGSKEACQATRAISATSLFPGLKKRLKGRHFSFDAEVIAAAETLLDGQPPSGGGGLAS
jgi:hypothetical protein